MQKKEKKLCLQKTNHGLLVLNNIYYIFKHSLLTALNGNQSGYPCGGRGGGGVLPSNRLMAMCRWMGSHFHDCIDLKGVVFSIELLEWGLTISGFRGKKILASRDFCIKKREDSR